MSRDIGNYRYDADFEIKVGEGVCWVPVCSLGKTRYTNEEMSAFCDLSPEEKREKIGNLFEAIQLFQISNFQGYFDNDDRFADGWQYSKHTAPRDTVTNNGGCCAADTNWLIWMLDGKYDYVGALYYGQRDGNGHIISHIITGGAHFFIDMMMARVDTRSFFPNEGASFDEWEAKEWAGFLYRCDSPLCFARFTDGKLIEKGRTVPFVYCLRDQVSWTLCKCELSDDNRRIFAIPLEDRPNMICIEEEQGKLVFADPPASVLNN